MRASSAQTLSPLPNFVKAPESTLDGAVPSGRIAIADGAIYGTTEYGGPNCQLRTDNRQTRGCGVVYRLTTASLEYSVIHAFEGDDGSKPNAGVTLGPDGWLYGTTDAGGATGHGVVYRVARDGTSFNVLYAFPNGGRHGALTVGDDGSVYGVAPMPSTGQGASIFALSPDGTYKTLYVFGAETHVAAPLLLEDGRLTSTLIRGGLCGGEIFWLTTSGAFGRIYSNAAPYTSSDCSSRPFPTSPLVDEAGTLYATGGRLLFRVGSDGVEVLHTLAPVTHLPGDMQAQFENIFVDGSLTAAPDGSLVAAITGSRNAGRAGARSWTCGALLRYTLGPAPTARETPLPLCYGPTGNPVAVQASIVYDASGVGFGTTQFGNACAGQFDMRVPFAPQQSRMGVACGIAYRRNGDDVAGLHAFEAPSPNGLDFGRFPYGAWIGLDGGPSRDRLSLVVETSPLAYAPYFARTGNSSLALHPVGAPERTIHLRFEHDINAIDGVRIDYDTRVVGTVPLIAPALAPGMYSLDTRGLKLVVNDADGFSLPVQPLYAGSLYEPPAPAKKPTLQPGQQFVSFAQPTGRGPVKPREDALQILTLADVRAEAGGNLRLTFHRAAGDDVTQDAEAADATAITGLIPIVDDASVDALVRKFAGHDAYVLGDFDPTCRGGDGSETNVPVDHASPIHVRRIVRLYGTSASWGIGPMTARMYGTQTEYLSVDPLLVIYDGVRSAQSAYSGFDCRLAYSEFSDAWDLERTLTLTNPFASHPQWSERIREAVRNGTVLVGMDYDMVVTSVGYPSVYGTAAEMRKLTEWDYILPAPSSFKVKFKNGKVVEYQPPGVLP